MKEFDENNDQDLEIGCEYHASAALHQAMLTQALPWIKTANRMAVIEIATKHHDRG